MLDESRSSFDVQPTSVEPPRRGRRPEPALVGVALVAVAIAVAIVKPWDVSTAPSASPSPVVATDPAVTIRTFDPTAPFDPSETATAASVVSSLPDRDSWGVGLVTPTADGPTPFLEAWQSVEPTPDDPVVPSIVASTSTVIAIRLTAPRTETPLDARAWARGRDGRWHWLDIHRFGSDLPAADLLLPPPTVTGQSLDAWPAGQYRFELLDGASVRRVDLTLDPSVRSNDVPADPIGPLAPDTIRVWPDESTVGLYVVEDSVVHPLTASPGEPLTPGQAWLSTDRVASDWRPRASAIGVLLPPGPTNIRGVLRRIGPDANFRLLQVDAAGTPHPAGARTSRIEFSLAPRAILPPGVYEMQVAWDGPEGHQSATWYVRLRPGPTEPTTALLRAARRYAAHAGTATLILSGAGRREPDADSAPVRVYPMARSIGCGTVLIDQTPAVLGFGHTGPPPTNIAATVSGPDDRHAVVPLLIADPGVPGLTLVEPRRGATFPAGAYDIRFDGESGSTVARICLGLSPFSG